MPPRLPGFGAGHLATPHGRGRCLCHFSLRPEPGGGPRFCLQSGKRRAEHHRPPLCSDPGRWRASVAGLAGAGEHTVGAGHLVRRGAGLCPGPAGGDPLGWRAGSAAIRYPTLALAEPGIGDVGVSGSGARWHRHLPQRAPLLGSDPVGTGHADARRWPHLDGRDRRRLCFEVAVFEAVRTSQGNESLERSPKSLGTGAGGRVSIGAAAPGTVAHRAIRFAAACHIGSQGLAVGAGSHRILPPHQLPTGPGHPDPRPPGSEPVLSSVCPGGPGGIGDDVVAGCMGAANGGLGGGPTGRLCGPRGHALLLVLCSPRARPGLHLRSGRGGEHPLAGPVETDAPACGPGRGAYPGRAMGGVPRHSISHIGQRHGSGPGWPAATTRRPGEQGVAGSQGGDLPAGGPVAAGEHARSCPRRGD